MRWLLLIFAIQVAVTPGNGKKNGRRGNVEFEAGRYDDAISLYRSGIEGVREDGPGNVHAGLLNNLGAAHFMQGEFKEAGTAFASSARMALTPEDRVRAAYNAGNAAAMGEELESALGFYRQALLEDPDNQDAKFNYEFVKRMLDEQQQQQQNQNSNDQNNEDQNEGEQNQQDQDSQQDQENQEEQPQDQEPQDQQQQQQQPQPQNPEELSQEEAERILQALQNEEEQLLRQVQRMDTRPRRVDKDW